MIKKIVITLVLLFMATFLMNLDGVTRLYFPKPGFGVSMIPDQSGKVVIITGGTSGIGKASAEQLCLKGAKLIVITGRSQAKTEKAAEEIQSHYCLKAVGSKVIGKELALDDHRSIESFVNWFKGLNEPLHLLMLNAGYGTMDREPTSTGLEKTVGVNWFGHFYLQHLLQDTIEKSAPSRIVITSSGGCAFAPAIEKPINKYVAGDEAYGTQQYMISKLFNVYHATELHRRLREKGIKNVFVNAVHPGFVNTNIFSTIKGNNDPFWFFKAMKLVLSHGDEGGSFLVFIALLSEFIGLDPIDGALAQLYAGTSPDIQNLDISGEYIYPMGRREDPSLWNLGSLSNLPPQVRNQTIATKVWEYGESIISSIPKDN